MIEYKGDLLEAMRPAFSQQKIFIMVGDHTKTPIKTKNTLDAIQKFNHIQLVVLGSCQLLACHFNQQICYKARCWLRTSCGDIPSEFVTRCAITNVIRSNLFSFGKDWITQLILEKQNRSNNTGHSQMVA